MAESVYYRFTTSGQPDDMFTVVRFRGEEGISTLYRFRIDLLADENDLDVDRLQNEPATFVIGAAGHERTIQGVIDDVEIVDHPNGIAIYRIELVPRVYELTRGTTNQIYIDNSTPDVIHQIMDRIGMTTVDFELELDQDYREWEFRLQYGESYWNFLARILERDGIYYYFSTDGESETVHFCDSARHQPVIEPDTLRFVAGLGFESSEAGETVHSLVSRRSRLLKRITLQNYNDAKPSTRITADIEVDPNGVGEADMYGQKVLDQAEADALAGIRAEELLATREQYHGESTVCLLSPAYRFQLDGHPRDRVNREYQVVTIEHRGYDPRAARQIGEDPESDAPAYDNRFTAIPADTQYRHPQATERPAIHGTLNARVDAAGDGQYAELDDEGRYHIVFPFDTVHPSGKASHWVRMMQPYAGEREGIHFPLRKGARVLISFLNGDPDLPVINGAITNAEQPSTTTGDNQTRGTIRTPGGNSIEADDNFGFEQLRIASTNCRTRLRIGADPHPTGHGSSVGAASNPQDAYDPDAPGEYAETVGMSRFAYFGGTNRFTGTNAWAIPQALWQDTRSKRDGELRLSGDIEDIKDYSDAQDEDWRVKHGSARVFRFPRKHPIPAGSAVEDSAKNEPSSDTNLTVHEEAEGRLLITRTVGDEYTYRSGTSFSFHGVDRETFDFGPLSSFSSVDHDEQADTLRAIVSDTLPGFKNLGSGYQTAYKKLEEARRKRDDARHTLQTRENRMEVLDNEGSRNSGNAYRSQAWAEPRYVFNDQNHFSEFLQLHNIDQATARANNQFDTITFSVNNIHPGAKVFARDGDDFSPQLDPAGTGSVAKAQREYDTAEDEYQSAKQAFDADYEIWPARVRENRVSVTKGDAFLWHQGEIFDFGGCWNYNLGNGYEENFIADQDINQIKDGSFDHDLLSTGGPNWYEASSPWTSDVNAVIKTKLQGNKNAQAQHQMDVSKTIGDTYDYHNGAALDVQVGPSLSVKKGGPNISKTFVPKDGSPDILVEHVESADGVAKTWRNHKHTGSPLYFGIEEWTAGKNSFSTEFAPSVSLDIKCAMTQANEMNLGFSLKTAINVGAHIELEVNAAAKTSVSYTASAEISFDSFTSAKIDLTVGVGAILEVDNYIGTKIEIDVPSGEIDGLTAGAGFHAKIDRFIVKAAVGSVTRKGVEIDSGAVKIGGEALTLKQ